jgi:hypothetical protein
MTFANALRGVVGFLEHAAATAIGFVLMVIGLGLGVTHDHAAGRRGYRADRSRTVCGRSFRTTGSAVAVRTVRCSADFQALPTRQATGRALHLRCRGRSLDRHRVFKCRSV